MSFYQIFLPIATILYLLVVFVLRSLMVWKRAGVNPFVFGKSESAHDYIGFIFKVLVVLSWIAIVFYSFIPKLYQYLLPVWYLENEWIRLSGLVLMVISFLWTILAQYHMGTSWRIGIDERSSTKLVTHGVFKFSRNPIFLGVLLTYLGTFLVIPNLLTATMLLTIYISLQIQVRLEEEYLSRLHGDEFKAYRTSVRRWI